MFCIPSVLGAVVENSGSVDFVGVVGDRVPSYSLAGWFGFLAHKNSQIVKYVAA
jgi:hypothetical protein